MESVALIAVVAIEYFRPLTVDWFLGAPDELVRKPTSFQMLDKLLFFEHDGAPFIFDFNKITIGKCIS
jgi:hypothetical protein